MNDKKDNKKRIYIGLAAVSAVLLICVVLVGMIDGFWPWEPGNGIIGEWIDPDFGKVDETTGSTEELEDPDTTESTSGEDTPNGNGQQSNKPSNNNNNNSDDEEEPTIGLEVGTPDATTPSGDTETENDTTGTDGEEEDDGPQITEDEDGNKGISFDDLKDKLNGGN